MGVLFDELWLFIGFREDVSRTAWQNHFNFPSAEALDEGVRENGCCLMVRWVSPRSLLSIWA